jgi:hypothetical protein
MDAAIIGVIGTLAGAFIGFWGAMKVARFQHFFSSGSNLKNTFLEVLVLLRQPKETFIDLYVIDVMENSFYKHEMAVVEFRYSLPASKRIDFDNAWRNYYESDSEGETILTKKYFASPNWQNEALSNIEAILEFADFAALSIWSRKIF